MLVVPADLVEQVITDALEKARAEKVIRREIEQGLSVTAAFEKYGIL